MEYTTKAKKPLIYASRQNAQDATMREPEQRAIPHHTQGWGLRLLENNFLKHMGSLPVLLILWYNLSTQAHGKTPLQWEYDSFNERM